jgi:hypothetical protein
MRFLELLKRPDSRRRATRSDPRSGITDQRNLGQLFSLLSHIRPMSPRVFIKMTLG